ncbi:hypothetical protein [Listeria rocourtiae]|uniref:hypothetical protein n=1 Tax=Listeria rocourtiae TaxID=647910 RepID=UPI0003E88BBF|nr:hypothetical protein [Listeria rocourtiae]EUJ42561.1 hypothetical protein PROCOU_16949 [Listeria rocourtiae FSL F6-920]
MSKKKRYLEEKRGFESKIEGLEASIARLAKQLEEAKAKSPWSIPNPSCFMQSSPFYGISVPTLDESTGEIRLKPPLGRPYYVTYKGKEYVKVNRAPKVGDVINVTSATDLQRFTTQGNELAKVEKVDSDGDVWLDHIVLGASSLLCVQSKHIKDSYDAVYELVQKRITYKGKPYVEVDRDPRKGDVIHITKFDGRPVDEFRMLIENDTSLSYMDERISGELLFDFDNDEYDAVYESVNA